MKPLESIIPSHVAEAIGGTLMHALWQLAAVALLLMVVLLLVPSRAARLRYWMAVTALGLMLVVPIGTFAYLYSPPAVHAPGLDYAVTPVHIGTIPSPVRPPLVVEETTGFLGTATAFFEDNAYLFLSIWMAGVFLFSLRFLGACWQVHRLRNRNIVAVPVDLQRRFEELLGQLGIRRNVQVRLSTAIDTPMVMGALKPVVLLPVSLLTGMSMAQVECILIHELAHVKRWDYLVNVVQSIAEIVLFFHPAAWWVNGLIRKERENCCDEWVVRLNSNKVEYARALLNLELLRQQPPAMALAAKGGDLKNRILRITGGVIPKERRFHTRGLLYGMMILAFGMVVATQGNTVVKAALPFLADEEPQMVQPCPTDPQNITPTQYVNTTIMNAMGAYRGAMDLASKIADIKFVPTELDSPITKVILNDKGDEVVLNFSKSGDVTSATRNGKPVSDKELEGYQEMANDLLGKGEPAIPPMPPIPPIPPMQNLDPLPPMPPLPAIPPMPPMPAMPALGDPASPGFDSKQYEKAMEDYGKQMAEWGKNYAQKFDTQAWEDYGKQAAKWAEQFSAQMGEFNTEEFERNMADFEEQMEEWAENLAEHIERSVESQAGHWEDMAREMEEMGRNMEEMAEDREEAARDAEEARKEADEAEREAAEAEREAERAGRDAERAERDAERAQEEAGRAESASEAIGDELQEDGLLQGNGSYKLKINDKELIVNGKQQSDRLHRKYKAMLEELLDMRIGKDWVTFNRNNSR